MYRRPSCFPLTEVLVCASLLSAPVPCFSNDSIAGWDGRTVRFERSEKIRVEQEVLYVSPASIIVNYVFFNTDSKTLHAKIAFPMPGPDRDDPGPEIQMKLFVNGREISGVWVGDATLEPRLPTGWRARTLLWECDFPAREAVKVRHELTGATGADQEIWVYGGDRFKEYCVDEIRFSPEIEKEFKDCGFHWSSYVRYLLTPAANWAGPIKHFELIIEKLSPDSFVSTCFEGLKKISPTKFKVAIDDFTPTEDLSVIWFHRWSRENLEYCHEQSQSPQ